jgi:hypothetical protein
MKLTVLLSHIEMGLHYGCSLVAASLKGLQSEIAYEVVHADQHYAKRVQQCASDAGGLPPPPSEEACEQPGTSLTAPLFAEVAEWIQNVRRYRIIYIRVHIICIFIRVHIICIFIRVHII